MHMLALKNNSEYYNTDEFHRLGCDAGRPKWATIMNVPANYKGLQQIYQSLEQDTQKYLSKLDPLLQDGRNFEIGLAYCFIKVEEGNHRALKCGLVRMHECNSQTVDTELEKQHFTHDKFSSVFKNVFGGGIPKDASDHLKKAQAVRNKMIHGKVTSDADRRGGIFHTLLYIKDMGDFVKSKTGKNPFGDLRGLAGKRKLLPAKSTIWMLKGFGLGERSSEIVG